MKALPPLQIGDRVAYAPRFLCGLFEKNKPDGVSQRRGVVVALEFGEVVVLWEGSTEVMTLGRRQLIPSMEIDG